MDDELRIVQLIIKQLRNTLSAQEQNDLQAWIDESPANREFMETRMQPDRVMADVIALLEKDDQAIRRKFEALCNEPAFSTTSIRRTGKRHFNEIVVWTVVAAAIIFFLLAGINLWVFHDRKTARPLAFLRDQLQKVDQSIEKPRLIFPNGDTIFLEKTTIGSIWRGEGWQVSQVDSQHVVYSFMPGNPTEGKRSTTNYISFSTPYGQSWRISLPDSSQVQLGTGSSLLYAANTPGAVPKERLTALQGEAWFEVTHNPLSAFVVTTSKGTTTAIGTSFNIRDYAREDSLLITLATGSLKVSNGKDSTTLLPRQEARIDLSSPAIRVITDVDVSKRLEWRSVYFVLTDMNTSQILKQLTNWYGMEGTTFLGKVDTVTPGLLGVGHVEKDKPLQDLLQKLLPRDNLGFQIENKKIILFPK